MRTLCKTRTDKNQNKRNLEEEEKRIGRPDRETDTEKNRIERYKRRSIANNL